ncbi:MULTISPECIES: pilus assembly protein TadG-related protein [Nocardiopsis]|uniref:Flp pilus assembly protein TadG n=2 Tax=Nocardiopsis TaxID=2013 RepID=A0A840WP94_9ACTN|nr:MULTISPECIES: pilus assembly protein TadG-related protein [Nocardiopsis]MBB5493427.1 Flp pilus assembly protein TadG [Nocardiopsis metallicus]MCK9873042.1 pilus assembly protein TadG-related protein [Nocardiopsis dassonvillei]MEE2051639.1 pilus assembly protein TadG-related protein [Nocardiopsis umidischolae]
MNLHPKAAEDRGTATAFLLIGALALLLFLALAIDTGLALAQKNRSFHLAQEAARVGAQEVDLATYRADGSISLDPEAAAAAARAYLADTGTEGAVTVDGDTVTVTTTTDFTFVLFPIGTHPVGATATATPLTDDDLPSP